VQLDENVMIEHIYHHAQIKHTHPPRHDLHYGLLRSFQPMDSSIGMRRNNPFTIADKIVWS
jgi:hypothetical protein